MADIIAESGLSAGAIYGHYKNKDDLIKVAITDLFGIRITEALGADTGTEAQAPGDVAALFISNIENETGNLGILLQVWAQAALDPDMQSVTTTIGEILRGTFEQYLERWYTTELGITEAEAARAAVFFAPLYVGIVQGYVVQSTIFSDFDGAAYLAAASGVRPDLAHLGAYPAARESTLEA